MRTLQHYIKRLIPGSEGVYQFLYGLITIPWFFNDYFAFVASAKRTTERFPLRWSHFFLCLFDKTTTTPFDPHYTYHPAWAARVVARTKPEKHIDIGSSLKFSTIVSAFIPVEFYDYRPAELQLSGLTSKHGDLLSLPFVSNSVKSLSCMHTIEHVGLGRYGEPIDYDGDIKACRELARVLAPLGSLLFVVPVGRSRIEYNAHRIYSYDQVLALFPSLQVTEFTLIPDDFRSSGLIAHADPALVLNQHYACGCFIFTKA